MLCENHNIFKPNSTKIKMIKLDKKWKKARIVFVGDNGWKSFRDLVIEKCSQCKSEEDFNYLLKCLLSSMFPNPKELDKARKQIGIELLSKREKKILENKLNG